MAGFGLKLASTAGFTPTPTLREYPILTSYTGVIARGDLVRLVSGYIQEASGNSAGNLGDTDMIGVFNGCRYVGSDGDYEFRDYWDGVAGKSNILASVVPVEGRRFYVKGNSGQTWAAANIGTTRNLIWATPSASTRESRVSLGAANETSGHAFIHGLADVPRNGYTAAGVTEPIFEVTITRVQGGLAVPYATT